ncbi:Oidioi.mRNA.OKI2018_I69.XSR.g16001.t1.cds [Oikopleura dioica]|uniref:Oidioi.mRNA.OKI2018_I69.XSR.g16001.t1.cds n=1 Tax=Oikopleura dioica TaxID=34765 RepID=A0ABN7SM01_OIKDI|nr:Oidioi.mRNA.OKI2018_I69.XSR.g16001.t1.cds [Oikopleura dioica]
MEDINEEELVVDYGRASVIYEDDNQIASAVNLKGQGRNGYWMLSIQKADPDEIMFQYTCESFLLQRHCRNVIIPGFIRSARDLFNKQAGQEIKTWKGISCELTAEEKKIVSEQWTEHESSWISPKCHDLHFHCSAHKLDGIFEINYSFISEDDGTHQGHIYWSEKDGKIEHH